MKKLLRASALLALILVARCDRLPKDSRPYESPVDCRCRYDAKSKRTVCTGACPPG